MDDSQPKVPAPKPDDPDAIQPPYLPFVPPPAPADLDVTQPVIRPAKSQPQAADLDATQATRRVFGSDKIRPNRPTNPDGDEATRRFIPQSSSQFVPDPALGEAYSSPQALPEAEQPAPGDAPARVKVRRWPWVLLGILLILAGVAAGGWYGYQQAVHQRMLAFTSQIAIKASTQYELGLADLREKRYALARTRFEYVISVDPVFPGAGDKLVETMLAMGIIATPTMEPTITPIPATPTPDMRGEAEIFNQIQTLMGTKKWVDAIAAMDTLRQKNLGYRAVDVDGMYYLALRNLGVQQILVEGSLEPGIYNLALAERFAPLDADADSYRTYARLYLTGASFWKLDWAQVVAYFSEIYKSLPNLRDASNMTAQERFRIGSTNYGDMLVSEGKFCDAIVQYEAALSLSPDKVLEPTATKAAQDCETSKNPPTATPGPVTPTPTPSLTPTPGTVVTPVPSATPPAPPPQTETLTPPSQTPPPSKKTPPHSGTPTETPTLTLTPAPPAGKH